MSAQPRRGTGLTPLQRTGLVVFVFLVVLGNLLSVQVSRSLSRTSVQVAEAGSRMTYIFNVARESGSLGLAAAQFGAPDAFGDAQLRHALLLRQVVVVREKADEAPGTARAMAQVDRRMTEVNATMESLGSDPGRRELLAAKPRLLAQIKAVEVEAKQLYDVAEDELLDVGAEAAGLQGTYQLALLGMGLLATGVTVGLVVSLRRRAGRDLTRAYEELYAASQERELAQERLEHQANTDVLTGLPNRAFLQDAITRIAGKHRDVAVLFIDLDGFKVVNDSLGHAAGDRLLQSVAQRLAHGVRTEDLVARLGGDEFTVVVTDERVPEAQLLAERLIRSLNEPFLLNDQVVFVGASIGIASTDEGERSPDALMRNADAAMYRAKENGRNRHETFTTTLHAHAVDRFRTESALRRAVERDELELHYQPVRTLADDQVSMVEALLRWRHDGVVVQPADFIPLAEEVGLMGPIGRWVLGEACRQRVEWGLLGLCPDDLAVSVNLSPRQFNDEQLAGTIAGILEHTGLSPRLLVLEITESVFLGDVESSKHALVALRSMGVRVALDDFGTGYSSLSHLRDLPIDAVKLDRSFVAEMCRNSRDALIIQAVITLAHSMGMTTVAEGVETAEQLRALTELGCDAVQGFLLSEPVPADELPAALEGRTLPAPRRATA